MVECLQLHREVGLCDCEAYPQTVPDAKTVDAVFSSRYCLVSQPPKDVIARGKVTSASRLPDRTLSGKRECNLSEELGPGPNS